MASSSQKEKTDLMTVLKRRDDFVNDLKNAARPSFFFGVTPPREGTSEEKAKEILTKFCARSAVLATDGFIVYDIQDEKGRVDTERPFPFRKTLPASWYASLFPEVAGKQCVVYKAVMEDTEEHFNSWLDISTGEHGNVAFNLVGGASSSVDYAGPSLPRAASIMKQRAPSADFGCVCIAERHGKRNEALSMVNKSDWGAEWFISQGVYTPGPMIKLLNDYGELCRNRGMVPKKVVITFTPCGRAKTMTFIKWLGMLVPKEIEDRILEADSPINESVKVLCEILSTILEQTAGSGVPLGINVESLSIFREEIDAAHSLFQKLQALLLNHRGSPWAVRWFLVHEVRPSTSFEDVAVLSASSPLKKAQSKDREVVPTSRRRDREAPAMSAVERTDGLALERSIMMATSLLSVATSAILLSKMFFERK